MIGIFDSGSGGLTVLRAIREVLPSSNIVYFADLAHAPYGSKSRKELSAFTMAAIKQLRQRGVQKIVSACNSVSASLAVSLLDAGSLQQESIIEMVGPTVSYFKDIDERIAICATQATVDAGLYETAFQMIDKQIVSIAIPDLAGAIEFGATSGQIDSIIQAALRPHEGSFDVLILACTHFPLVAAQFTNCVGEGVKVFDPAYAVAERAEKLFWPQEVAGGQTQFVLSAASNQFERYVSDLFPGLTYTLEVIE